MPAPGGHEPREDITPSAQEGEANGDKMAVALADDDKKASTTSFCRLPKGESVGVRIERGRPLPLLLYKHRFHIVLEAELQLVDARGHGLRLRPGKNVIGRDTDCSVVVGQELAGVSRKHLIVETEGDRLLHLTDISSLGTAVCSRHVACPSQFEPSRW